MRVSRTARTALEAEATPDELVPDIEKLVAEGEFSYEAYGDEQARQDAAYYIESAGGMEKAFSDWERKILTGWSSKLNTAIGWELYRQAAADPKHHKLAISILSDMVAYQRDRAQGLQAQRILKRLSPQGQLYDAQQQVARIQQDLDERHGRKGWRKRQKEAGDASRVQTAIQSARQDAAKNLRTEIDRGEPFLFEYANSAGRELARAMERTKNRAARQRTYMEEIVSDLRRLAADKAPALEKRRQRTAIDLLRDYVQNEEFFRQAWEQAQLEIRERHADDANFSEFLNTGIGIESNPDAMNSLFLRAIVNAASQTKEIVRIMAEKNKNAGDAIADYLIRQTGADGVTAQTIRDAARWYAWKKRDASNLETDIRNAMHEISVKVKNIVDNPDAKRSARDSIIALLLDKYGFLEADAIAVSDLIGQRFDALMQESARRRLESIFDRDPRKRRTVQERFQQLAALGAFQSEAYNTLAAKRIIGDVPNIQINPELAEQFLQAGTQEERDTIMKQIYHDIGRQMPSNLMDKVNAIRYTSMLANPRTHIRNFFGNMLFTPAVAVKNLTATELENMVYFLSGRRTERGKALVGLTKRDRELLHAASGDFNAVYDIISGVGKYADFVDAKREIQEGRRIFQSNNRLLNLIARPMEGMRRFNSGLMEWEDMFFSRPHYAYALAQYCKAHGISAQDIQNGVNLENARAYAVKEAQKATFRDANALSQWFSSLGKPRGRNPVGRALSMLMDGMQPFRATPANMLARGLEYSPIGLLANIAYGGVQLRRGNMTATQFIDSISAGLTGSGLFMLGWWLASQGLIRGHGSDDEEEEDFLQMLGHQQYSVEIGGTSYTLDWLAPEAIPFLSGVNVFESALRSGGLREMTMEDWFGVVKLIGEPLMQMSFLQSINDVFDAVKYADSRNVDETVAALASAATSYLTQFFPTLGGQIERASQADRMTTYTNPNAFLTTDMQYTLGSISARVPGVDYQQIPYIDAWGRKETEDSALNRVFNNFISPGYSSEYAETDFENELLRLYRQTGETGVFPNRADRSITVDGEEIYLSADDYVKYATEKGQRSRDLAEKIYNSAAYDTLTDETKAEAISDAYEFANAAAKASISDYEPSGWVKNAMESGIDPEEYILSRVRLNQSGSINSFNAMLESGINNDAALTASSALEELEPESGKDKVSDMQKYQKILNTELNEADKQSVLKYLMPNGTAEKFSTAVSYGITSEQYVDYMEHADANGNGSVTQKEAQDMISSISGLSQQQRAVLWQLQNKSWKSENNPFGYSGIQQEPESGGLTLGGGGSTTEGTTQSTNFGQLILGGNRR